MACNTQAAPDAVKPTPLGGATVDGERIRLTLAPASWNTVRLVAE
jgi:alpha-L-arabinofuranosidase